MAKANQNYERERSPTAPPVAHSFQEPVIVSGNRYYDIGPYSTAIYNAEPLRWAAIMPWEFPQNAPREVEETFLKDCFGEHEIHMQGGMTHEGSGYRFLKQVWYTIAIWNAQDRVPRIAQWWWHRPCNRDLINDVRMLEQMCKPEAKLESLFSKEDIEAYGHKSLFWAMKHIQDYALCHKKNLQAIIAKEAKRSLESNPGLVDTAIVASSVLGAVNPPTPIEDLHKHAAKDGKVQKAAGLTLHIPTHEARDVAIVHHKLPDTTESTPLVLEQHSEDSKVPATLELTATTSADCADTLAIKASDEGHESVAQAQPAISQATEAIQESAAASQAQPAISQATETIQESAAATQAQPATSQATETIQESAAVTQAQPSEAIEAIPESTAVTQAQPGEAILDAPSIPQASPAKATTGDKIGDKAVVTQQQLAGHGSVPLRADNDDFVPRLPMYGPPTQAQYDIGYYNPQQVYRGPGQMITEPYMQEGHAAGNAYGMQYNNQRGMQERRGSRGSMRRMSRGGRETYARLRSGSSVFENDADYASMQQPGRFQDRRNTHAPPPVQFVQYTPGMPIQHMLPGSSQQQTSLTMTQPEQMIPQAVKHEGHMASAARPAPLPATTQSARRPSNANLRKLGPDDVDRDYIGSNRHEVDTLVAFGFPSSFTGQELKQVFTKNGLSVSRATIAAKVESNWNPNNTMAFVVFSTHDEARRGLSMHGYEMGGNRGLVVEVSKEFWDPSHTRFRDRYLSEPQRSANGKALVQQEGTLTPRTNPFDSPGSLNTDIPMERIDTRMSVEPSRLSSLPLGGKHSKLPTQDARFMGPKAQHDGVPAKAHHPSASQSTGKTESPLRKKSEKFNKKNRKSSGVEDGKPVQLEKSNYRPPQSTQDRSSKPTAQHKDKTEASVVEKKAESAVVATQPTTAPSSTSRTPTAGADQPLKIAKREAAVSASPIDHTPAKINEQSVNSPKINEQGLDSSKITKLTSMETPSKAPHGILTKSAANTSAQKDDKQSAVTVSPVEDGKPKLTAMTPAQKDDKQSTSPVEESKSVTKPSISTHAVRVATPKRAIISKLSTSDEATQSVSNNEVPRKATDVVTSTREVSDSMPPTPASAYTTAPPTPTNAKSAEKIKENIQEKSKGPAQTESLSMFGKKQTKPKKTKGKTTLKEKPQEYTKMAEEFKMEQDAAAAAAKATTKQTKTKKKIDKHAKVVSSSTNTIEDVKQEKTASVSTTPVTSPSKTSPSKRKLGISSLFGLLSRPSSNNTPAQAQDTAAPVQAVEAVPEQQQPPSPERKPDVKIVMASDVTNTVNNTEAKQDVVSQIPEHQSSNVAVHHDIDSATAEASTKSVEHDEAVETAVEVESPKVQSVEDDKTTVVGLGLSGLPALHIDEDKSKCPVEAFSSSDSDAVQFTPESDEPSKEEPDPGLPQASFEPEKGEDARSESSQTVSASSTPSNMSPSKIAARSLRGKHLIEAPPARNARKRRQQRPQSVNESEKNGVITSQSVISGSSSNAGSSDDGRKPSTPPRTVALLKDVEGSPGVYQEADGLRDTTLFLLLPPVEDATEPSTTPDGSPTQFLLFRTSSPIIEADRPAVGRVLKEEIEDSDDNTNDLVEELADSD